MTDPTFGIAITRSDTEARPAIFGDLSVVGIIGTAPDANATLFPLDTPTFMYSDDATMLAALGVDGTLADAVTLLNSQVGEFQSSAKLVIVRVEEGADADETIGNIVGDGITTGLKAFIRSGPEIGSVPRLICAPGFTSQRDTGVDAITVGAQGSGYSSAPTVTLTGGGGTGAAATAVLGTGGDADKVVSVTVTNGGSGYTSAPTIGFTGGAGSGATATATVADLANGVCAALVPICETLLAHAVVDGPATTKAAALSWRETINSDRLIPVDPAVKVLDDGAVVVQPISPAIVGIGVRRDHEFNGRPFHSWANQPVQGIVGPSRPIAFSLTDGATEGQDLLAANVGILVRGEMGVEGSISSGGFVYIGTDNAGDDELWRFYNQTRGRDYIHLMFLASLRTYLGKVNITGQTVRAIINQMEFGLRDLQATGDIIGFKVDFTRDQNSPEELRLGRIKITFKAEEAPVLRYLGIQSGRYREALDVLLDDLTASLSA
jgi:uncharacterized protein